jgi:hypothetical protein
MVVQNIAASLRQRDKDAIEADYNLREIIRLPGCDWRLQASGHGRVQQPLDQLLERNCPFGRAHFSTSLPPAPSTKTGTRLQRHFRLKRIGDDGENPEKWSSRS